jgi:hypothetical protein
MSVFLERNHLFLRDPRGGVEDIAAMRDAGFGAVFCNIGDHDPADWQTIRARAGAAGVVCGPWLRTADSNNTFDRVRFRRLLEVADLWESPLIVNTESEIQGTGDTITSYINDQLGDRDAAISMEPWPFDNVSWVPLAERPMMPQLARAVVDFNEEGLRDIWHGYGIKCVVMTFGSFGGSRPSDYDRLAPFGHGRRSAPSTRVAQPTNRRTRCRRSARTTGSPPPSTGSATSTPAARCSSRTRKASGRPSQLWHNPSRTGRHTTRRSDH